MVLGLLWCNLSFAETEQSIRDKYKSELAECNDGIIEDYGNTKKWMKWDNCVGKLKMETNDGSVLITSEFKNGIPGGKSNMVWNGETFFMIYKKEGGCKRNGHAIKPNGKLYKIKWNKSCDNPTKYIEIK